MNLYVGLKSCISLLFQKINDDKLEIGILDTLNELMTRMKQSK